MEPSAAGSAGSSATAAGSAATAAGSAANAVAAAAAASTVQPATEAAKTAAANIALQETLEDFLKFLQKSNVVQVAIASVIGINVNELSRSFVENIIVPIIDAVLRALDLYNLADMQMYIFDIRLKIGKFTIVLIRVIMTVIFLYFFIVIVPNFIKLSMS